MSRLLKLLVGVVLTGVFLIVVVPFLINWNNYKPEIQQAVLDKTGRQLTIEGDINIRLLPTPQASIEKVHLSNLAGAKSKDFISVEEVQVQLALLPLLSKQVKVTALTIEQPSIWLETMADGRASWQLKPQEKIETTVQTEKTTDTAAVSTPAVDLSLDAVQVNDATIIYQDYKSAKPMQFSDLSAFIQAPSLQGPFNLKGEVKANDLPVEWQLEVAELKSGAPIALTLNSKIASGINVAFDGVIKQDQQPSLRGKLDFNLADYANLKAIAKSINIPEGLTGGLVITSEVFANKSGVAFDPMTVKTMGFNLPSKVQYKFAGSPQLYANVQGFPGSTEFEIFANSVGGESTFDGKIGLASQSIAEALAFVGQKLPAPLSGVKKVVMNADLKVAGPSIAAKDLLVYLDNTKVTGGFSLDRVAGQSDLTLRSNSINLDTLSSGRPAQAASTGSNSAGAVSQVEGAQKTNAIALPAFLKNGQHAFDVKVDRLQKDGNIWKDVVAKGALTNGELVLKTASVSNEEGLRAEASGTVKDLAVSPNANLEFVAHHPTSGGVTAKGKMQGWTEQLTLDTTVKAPSADLNGVVKGDINLAGKQKTVDALIQLKALDLDLLQKLKGNKQGGAVSSSSSVATSGAVSSAGGKASNKPFLPADMAGEVVVEIEKLVSKQISLQDVKATAKLADQTLRIDDLFAQADDGQITGQVVVNGKTAVPDYQVALNTKQVDLAKALWKSKLPITGVLDSQFNFNGKGLDKDAILRSLSGAGDYSLNNMRLANLNIEEVYNLTKQLSDGGGVNIQDVRTKALSGTTLIDHVKGHLSIQNGILDLGSPEWVKANLTLKPTGKVNLVDQTMNVPITVSHQKYPGVNPVFIYSGNISNYNVSVDLNSSFKNLLQQKTDKLIDKGLNKLFDKKKTQEPAPTTEEGEASDSPAATEQQQDPKQDAKDALKGLFKRAIQ